MQAYRSSQRHAQARVALTTTMVRSRSSPHSWQRCLGWQTPSATIGSSSLRLTGPGAARARARPRRRPGTPTAPAHRAWSRQHLRAERPPDVVRGDGENERGDPQPTAHDARPRSARTRRISLATWPAWSSGSNPTHGPTAARSRTIKTSTISPCSSTSPFVPLGSGAELVTASSGGTLTTHLTGVQRPAPFIDK